MWASFRPPVGALASVFASFAVESRAQHSSPYQKQQWFRTAVADSLPPTSIHRKQQCFRTIFADGPPSMLLAPISCDSVLQSLVFVRPKGPSVMLTPPRPTWTEMLSGTTSAGTVASACSGGALVLQAGPYHSVWLRVPVASSPAEAIAAELPVGDFSEVARTWLAAFQKTGREAAFYVALPESSPFVPEAVRWLQTNGFSFHHYNPPPTIPTSENCSAASAVTGDGNGELIYYRWCGRGDDRVPSFATSGEGVGVVLLSPDECSVLLVWENGNWKTVTGAVDTGEGVLGAATRELSEEVGVQVDPSFKARYVGGWHFARRTDSRMNDSMHIIVLRAQSREFCVNKDEITAAKWFDLDKLPLPTETFAPGYWIVPFDSGVSGKYGLNSLHVRFLGSFRQGCSFVCHQESERLVYEAPRAGTSSIPVRTTTVVPAGV